MQKNLVMVFGVFDRLHPGHRNFLKQAKRYGKELVAVVARESAVQRLKNRKPAQNETIRLRDVRRVSEVSHAVLGDRKEGNYRVIKKYKPDVICLGYDQKSLKKDLEIRMRQGKVPVTKIKIAKAFRPKKYHSSIRNEF